MKVSKNDILFLENLYKDRKPFYGELHDHAATGGTSDGKKDLNHWKAAMEALKMDFAAILDHRQVRHMFLPQWDDEIFICGTEPGTYILDSKAEKNGMHYNMVVPKAQDLMEILTEFDEYKFEGGTEGHFIYPKFTTERFCKLINAVKEKGGLFVHPHPKLVMVSNDPLDYWFVDDTGLEVFYNDYKNQDTSNNYKLWTELLDCGKRVWACAGGDGHVCASNLALTTVYAEERYNTSYLSHIAKGDFVCGFVGIRMCIGNTKMGGVCQFNNQKLIVSIGDFHSSVIVKNHKYSLEVLNDKGLVKKHKVYVDKTNYFTFDVEECKFYRAEVIDETTGYKIAIGNPIWNVK